MLAGVGEFVPIFLRYGCKAIAWVQIGVSLASLKELVIGKENAIGPLWPNAVADGPLPKIRSQPGMARLIVIPFLDVANRPDAPYANDDPLVVVNEWGSLGVGEDQTLFWF